MVPSGWLGLNHDIHDHKICEKRCKDVSKTLLVFKLLTVHKTLAQPTIPITTAEHTNANKTCHVCFSYLKV